MAERVPASRKLGETQARDLIVGAKTIYVAKGGKVEVFAGGMATRPIISKLLGATGNLRAPTIKTGEELLVGFHEGTYHEVLGV